MLNETKDFSGKHVRLYMGNGEYSQGKVWSVRKIGDHWQFSFDRLNGSDENAVESMDWHWADTRFVQEIKTLPMARRIVNFIIRALGYKLLNKLFRKMGL